MRGILLECVNIVAPEVGVDVVLDMMAPCAAAAVA